MMIWSHLKTSARYGSRYLLAAGVAGTLAFLLAGLPSMLAAFGMAAVTVSDFLLLARDLGFMLVASIIFALLYGLVQTVGIAVFLRKRVWRGAKDYALAGIGVGVVPTMAASFQDVIVPMPDDDYSYIFPALLVYALCGAVGGVVWWWRARQGEEPANVH